MMYDRMKNFLQRCVGLLVHVLLFSVGFAYLIVSSIIMTAVVNQIRLDSYIGVETGFGIVTLIILLGWCPYWITQQRSEDNYYRRR